MGMNGMTPEEYNVLDQLTYLDFGFDGTDTSGNLQQICQRVAAQRGKDAGDTVLAVARGDYPGLNGLSYAGGVNHNDTTGLVAYAFQDGDTVICSYRGSEGEMLKNVDWRDNLNAGLHGHSIQYGEALEFAREMSQGKDLNVTGHSKGGNLAMYVASKADNCTGGVAYDSQGFPPGYLTEADIQRLKDSGLTNYVVDNDYVGSLLVHDENRVFVKGKNWFDFNVAENHKLENIRYDENGKPIPSQQSRITRALERVTSQAAEYTVIATRNEILVPREEMLATVSRFSLARNDLQGAYERMESAMAALNNTWSGVAHQALEYQWKSIYGNIVKADEKMEDAICELRIVHDLFSENERQAASGFASLSVGESPFA